MIIGILLAAGRSTRMGTPKQLLPFGDKTVIETVVDALLNSRIDDLIVVLGHERKLIAQQIKEKPLSIVVNSDSNSEMLDSLKCGIRELPKTAHAFILALVDQPRLETVTINTLIDSYHESGKKIIIPTHDGHRGHPSLIDSTYSDEILNLGGVDGLKPIVRGHINDTLELEVTQDFIINDMDTQEDYKNELKKIRRTG